jgi:ABC-type nitrate/sulfonate/bicarbonate transport system substrate-binding protein
MLANSNWAASLRTARNTCRAMVLAGSLALGAGGAAAQTAAAVTAPATPAASTETGAGAAAQTLHIVGFEGAFNLPVWVAQQKGFFAANGLTVDLSFPPNSVEVIRSLTTGSAQLALMSVDNVLAYRREQGEKGAPDANDLVVFMGGDHGYLTLVARHGIDTVAQLRGQTVSVDAMTTGFAFVLFDALQTHHLSRTDVNIVKVGGTGYRYRTMMAGKQDATLLRTPFELLAQQQGFNVLLPASRLTPDYQGTIGAVRGPWAAEHKAEMIAFLTAYHQALEWIFDARNQQAALGILHAEYPALTQPYLLKAYRGLKSHRDGLIRDMTVDRAGLAEVERLRDKYAPLANGNHADPKIVDLDYLRAARQTAAWHVKGKGKGKHPLAQAQPVVSGAAHS